MFAVYAVERYKDIPGTKTHKPSLNPPSPQPTAQHPGKANQITC